MKYNRHSMSYSRTYICWQNLKSRCKGGSRKNDKNYKYRGIDYCERWEFFINFLEDMGELPDGYQIDRIDNSKGYFKENCRYVPPSTNNANKRRCSKNYGVYTVKGCYKFYSRIKINKNQYHLGSFGSIEDAQNEYKKVFKEWYGFNPDKEIMNDYTIN